MLNRLAKACGAIILAISATMAGAETWTLDRDGSRLAFGSVKKDVIGEVHHFPGLSGTVLANGQVNVDIDLTTVQTNIDIRNERMNAHVFDGSAVATLLAEIDMEALDALPVGATEVLDVDATLKFLGQEIDLYSNLLVARLGEGTVMVTTNDMIFVEVEDLGITAGIDRLMELAKLPGITRTVPVTFRLLFNMDGQKAEADPAAPAKVVKLTDVQFAGDAKQGKRVFNKCRACHQVKPGRNAVGPTLHQIVGAPAGAVAGYRYSEAMAGAGLTWDNATLAAFLAKPKEVVPGNKMGFAGLKSDEEIANLIAYLAGL